jgi:hypothetical protein
MATATVYFNDVVGGVMLVWCRIGSRVGCLQAVFVCCVDMSGRWLCVVSALSGTPKVK